LSNLIQGLSEENVPGINAQNTSAVVRSVRLLFSQINTIHIGFLRQDSEDASSPYEDIDADSDSDSDTDLSESVEVHAKVADWRIPSPPSAELENGDRGDMISPDNWEFSGKTLLGDTPELKQAWKLLVAGRLTDDQALFRFETALDEFISSSDESYPLDAPWPVTYQQMMNVTVDNLPGEIKRLFAYAEKVQSKEHTLKLICQTIYAFQPDLWRAKNMFGMTSESVAGGYASKAEIVVTNVAELLQDALDAK